MTLRILVSGASGFVGRALCKEAKLRNLEVRAAMHNNTQELDDVEAFVAGNIDASTKWTAALKGVDVIIHLAARAHVMKETSSDPLVEFRKVNVLGTENLARQAAECGVRRMVFVSSIGVNGTQSIAGIPFTEEDIPSPHNAYAQSKLEAEQSLIKVSEETGLEVVILRPPLVYGDAAKGNLAWLVKILQQGWPLPFASIKNLRSMIYLGNLVDALILCAQHPAAAGEVFLVRDGQDVSTPEFIRAVASALGVGARLFPFPPMLLHAAATMTGKKGVMPKLDGFLQINDGKIRERLGWAPPYTFQSGMANTFQPRNQ